MRVLDGSWSGWETSGGGDVILGVFDGVHLGHRALLALADPNTSNTVITFDPHPIEVLRPGAHPRLLTTLEERVPLLGEAGADQVAVLDLSEIRHMSPSEFVGSVIVEKLKAERVIVGADFKFGNDRAGDVEMLSQLGVSGDFSVSAVDLVPDEHGPISSSRIRRMVEACDVGAANSLLGSRFQLTNEVVHGDKRGRTIGFPTANLRPPSRKVLPGAGVYAGTAAFGGEKHMAAVNVGTRPTFDGSELVVEAFLLDYDGDLYGRMLTIEFVEHLRPELRFSGVDDLVAQMNDDVAASREILGEVGI